MLVAPGDYTKAKIAHWLYNADGSVSGIASSEKQPLENRVWSRMPGSRITNMPVQPPIHRRLRESSQMAPPSFPSSNTMVSAR